MLNIPLFRQRAGHCGPASLKMLIGYFGVNETHSKLAALTKVTRTSGTSHENLISATRKLGFSVHAEENGSWEMLNEYINKKKIPVLVDWFSQDDGHYSIAVGLSKNSISLADPEFGAVRKLSWKTFNRVWFDFAGDQIDKKSDVYLRWYLVAEK